MYANWAWTFLFVFILHAIFKNGNFLTWIFCLSFSKTTSFNNVQIAVAVSPTVVDFHKSLPLFVFAKGPFKYYVSIFLSFLGPPTHLFADVILEWSPIKSVIFCKSFFFLKLSNFNRFMMDVIKPIYFLLHI